MKRIAPISKLFSATMTLVAFALLSSMASAQTRTNEHYGVEQGQTPVFQLGFQYDATHANAPPSGGCGCFWMQGGGMQFDFTIHRNWSAAADLYGAGASQINGTDERLSIFNYVFGPRYSLWNHTKYTPYAQALFGGSEVFSNFAAYGSGRTSFAAQVGGGIQYHVNRLLSVVPVEANWVHSQAVNAVNDRQNNIRLGAGITFRVGPR
jgi:outer membrane immunogenic protein